MVIRGASPPTRRLPPSGVSRDMQSFVLYTNLRLFSYFKEGVSRDMLSPTSERAQR